MAGSVLGAGDPINDARSALRPLQRHLMITDLFAIIWAAFGAQVVRFGIEGSTDVAASNQTLSVSYTSFTAVLVLTWWLALRLHGAYDARILGHGTAEYRLIAVASLEVFAGVAMLAFALDVAVARGYILLALPAGIIGLWGGRRLWRTWLGGRRSAGDLTHDVLVVGDEATARQLIDTFVSVPEAGYRVIGVCTTLEPTSPPPPVPVLGVQREAGRVAIELGVDVIACADSHVLGTSGLRRLGWVLEGSDIGLVVSPGLTEIAGPRVISRPVAGLPLLHVEVPTFSGPRLVLKSTIDWCGALILVILFAPVLVTVAIATKWADGGPVFFRQERVGREGATFWMTKFRSMSVDAEARLMDLRSDQDGPDPGVLFKMKDDPRVTPVGRFIRRYSIDELPQLFDVLSGKMSLVGPRPPLPSEVARYEGDVARRLLVKPGMTGLWQINGRSDLTWDESVRFDLYYVENWSVSQDLIILWRTLAAVVGKNGAY